MLVEMGQIGIPMLLAILAMWGIMVYVENKISYKSAVTNAN